MAAGILLLGILLELSNVLNQGIIQQEVPEDKRCLLYTSDAADDLLCVDLGGRRIIKKKQRLIPASSLSI